MYAQLEYNLTRGSAEVKLALYRSPKEASDDPNLALLVLPLTNQQLSELVIVAKIKPVDMDK